MLWIQENQRVTVWKVEDKGKYSEVKFSSARKDKNSGDYKNSTWSFVRFVGEAHKKASTLKEKDRIELKGAGFSIEEYTDKEGNRAWPKNPSLVVFNFEKYVPEDSQPSESPDIDEDEEEMPDFLK